MGASATQLEIWSENHQINHARQNVNQQQILDQHITSDVNPPDASSLASTARKRKDEPNSLDAEEVETEVFKRIKEEIKSLPLALQSMAI